MGRDAEEPPGARPSPKRELQLPVVAADGRRGRDAPAQRPRLRFEVPANSLGHPAWDEFRALWRLLSVAQLWWSDKELLNYFRHREYSFTLEGYLRSQPILQQPE
eukprot:bmy_20084T0